MTFVVVVLSLTSIASLAAAQTEVCADFTTPYSNILNPLVRSLSAYNISCPFGHYISHFQLQKGEGKHYRYAFSCCKARAMSECGKALSHSLSATGPLDLDRFAISCSQGKVFTQFNLKSEGVATVACEYTCCAISRLGRCNNETSPWKDVGVTAVNINGDVRFLEGQVAKCPIVGSAIRSFGFNAQRAENSVQYWLTCCQTGVVTENAVVTTATVNGAPTNPITIDLALIQCSLGEKVPGDYICDGANDCDDGSDESLCQTPLSDDERCESKTTPINAAELGNAERHIVSCPAGQYITQFKFERPNLQSYQYSYKCCKAPRTMATCASYTTVDTEEIGPFDKQPAHFVTCSLDSVLTKFQLTVVSPIRRYNYTCCKVILDGPCTLLYTPWKVVTSGHIAYPDRHNVQCSYAGAMPFFAIQAQGEKYRYAYMCCSISSHLPA